MSPKMWSMDPENTQDFFRESIKEKNIFIIIEVLFFFFFHSAYTVLTDSTKALVSKTTNALIEVKIMVQNSTSSCNL